MSRHTLTTVPLADPRADNAIFRSKIVAAMETLIGSGQYILGENVRLFEELMASRTGTQAAVGVGSGTDALVLALLAAGIGRGDEVIVPSHTAGPSIAAINVTGATPVFADICSDTYCIDPESVEACLSRATKAILVVHLYGHPADLTPLQLIARAKGVILIEDCAQAQGARYRDATVGSIGNVGCFSFYPTKNLGALGDGGAITTDSERAEIIRQLRTYGWRQPQYAEIPHGRCSRLDEIQAAILRIKFAHLDQAISARRRIADIYVKELQDTPLVLPIERADCMHTYHLFVVRSDRRDNLRAYLNERGVATGIHYPFAGHAQPGLAAGSRIPLPLARTEAASAQILSLPMFSSMTDSQIDRVVDPIRSFSRRSG